MFRVFSGGSFSPVGIFANLIGLFSAVYLYVNKASVLEAFNIFKDMFVKSAESKSPTRTSGMVCGISFDYIITNKKKRLVDNDW